MKVAIASDHAGYKYKEKIISYLKERGFTFKDFGTYSDESCDYPDFVKPAAEAVASSDFDRGIVLGGSGNGEAIVANKVKGIRCTLCWNIESAVFARSHNDSNVLSLGERMIPEDDLFQIVSAWLETPFDGGRHKRRINKIESQ